MFSKVGALKVEPGRVQSPRPVLKLSVSEFFFLLLYEALERARSFVFENS